MNKTVGNKISIRTRYIILTLCGIALNFLFSSIFYKLGLPLYFDTFGTIAVAALTGSLFPAICTAISTSVIYSFFYWPAIYLSAFNAIIAVITIAFVRRWSFKQVGKILIYVPVVALISSLSVSLLQYFLNGINDASLSAKKCPGFFFSRLYTLSAFILYYKLSFILS